MLDHRCPRGSCPLLPATVSVTRIVVVSAGTCYVASAGLGRTRFARAGFEQPFELLRRGLDLVLRADAGVGGSSHGLELCRGAVEAAAYRRSERFSIAGRKYEVA